MLKMQYWMQNFVKILLTFDEILTNFANECSDILGRQLFAAAALGRPGHKDGGLRGEQAVHDRERSRTAGHDTALFRKLVLGWIEADFRVQLRIFQHQNLSKSTRKSSSREQILQISVKNCKKFNIF